MKFAPVALIAGAMAGASLAAPPRYAVATTIAGPDGGWDYASVDSAAQHLYVARSASVTAIDLAKGGAVADLGKIARGHAVVPLPGGRLLVTSGNDATVRILDVASGAQLASLAVDKKPDAAVYDPATRRAYVINAGTGSISVIDTAALRVERTIPVKPALEEAVLTGRGMLFVNNEDANEIEPVDVARGTVGKPIALTGCEGPTGLGYDARHGRLISACANGKAAIVDVRTHKLVGLIDIGRGPDGVAVDNARAFAFIPCGKDGVLEILSIDGAQAVKLVGVVKTEPGARTIALDPVSGSIYLPTARFEPPKEPGARPAMIPGSFHVVVVRRG